VSSQCSRYVIGHSVDLIPSSVAAGLLVLNLDGIDGGGLN
jgi:hypothetical protein